MIHAIARGALVCALALGAAGASAQTVLNVNTALTTDDPVYAGLERFKAAVEQRSAGKLQVRIFPGSQLGKDEDVLEQARAGANVAVLVDGGRLAPFVKEFGILGAPYLFDDYGQLLKLEGTPLFASWVDKLRNASQHQVLSFNWFQGHRHVLTNVPVKTPADLKGIRMRTPGAPVWLETVRALGATPTGMAWTEVYSALQTKVIDGAEAQHPAVYGAKLYEVVKYVTKTEHIFLITGLVTSRAWFDKLPADQQRILREESFNAGKWASEKTIESLADYERKLREKGVTVAEVDKAPFRSAASGVYQKLGYAELRDQVNKALGK
ncbi:MAG: C4-dicarboxylate TRAP transporter substrate-binding protein [Burkholderiales bacterium]|nr:C4-dicarboxylate TRAP transporter substrate-binding protein [Burkholderiales bacterium]GIK87464.1 MAG: C4-dicarboxylate ABC transporter [Betaproteobacteria bacterium]